MKWAKLSPQCIHIYLVQHLQNIDSVIDNFVQIFGNSHERLPLIQKPEWIILEVCYAIFTVSSNPKREVTSQPCY